MTDRISKQELDVEKFVFHAPPATLFDSGMSPKLSVGVGERMLSMDGAYWSEDLELVRFMLEGYAFTHKTTLIFRAPLCEWEIKLEQETSHYPEIMLCRVEIRQKHSSGDLEIVGYCEEKKTLTTLYEGLLRATFYQPETLPEEWVYYAGPDRLTAYEQIKSPILESYISDEEFFVRTTRCLKRQVHIKRVLTLFLDNCGYLEDDRWFLLSYDDIQALCGLPEIEATCYLTAPSFGGWDEVKPDITTISEITDKGKRLAEMIRGWLPKEYDLWIEMPVIKEGKIDLELHLLTREGTIL